MGASPNTSASLPPPWPTTTESGNAPKAIEYLERSGRRAEERFAYVEAVSHFSAALELLRAMPRSPQRAEREMALLLALRLPINLTRSPAHVLADGLSGRRHLWATVALGTYPCSRSDRHFTACWWSAG